MDPSFAALRVLERRLEIQMGRAAGALGAVKRVRECGTRHWMLRCDACGSVPEGADGAPIVHPDLCGRWLLCPDCARSRSREAAEHYVGAWDRLAASAPWMQLRTSAGWSETQLTVTVPHSGDVALDISRLRRAFPRFLRALREHVERDLGESSEHLVFLRALDVSEGSNGRGHAHLHVVIFAPRLDLVLVRWLWGRALRLVGVRLNEVPADDVLRGIADVSRRERLRTWLRTRRGPHGRPLASLPRVVIDIRRIDAHAGIAHAVRAWPTRSWSANLVARLYVAMDGVRVVTASRELRAKPKSHVACHECEAVGALWRVSCDACGVCDVVEHASALGAATAPAGHWARLS
ncbi:MAG: hypothetical protein IT379_33560 [Deltaproteobacteria bacterium]|nr:hypothetical protein [Deltaproteobacteria bacterium]